MHTVVPNLKRLNLITERTEDAYRKIGVLWGEPGQARPQFGQAN